MSYEIIPIASWLAIGNWYFDMSENHIDCMKSTLHDELMYKYFINRIARTPHTDTRKNEFRQSLSWYGCLVSGGHWQEIGHNS